MNDKPISRGVWLTGPKLRLSAVIVLLLVVLSVGPPLLAGPPFMTDDPEPVEHQHWEFYVASQYANDNDGASGTAPHVELNYGVVPDVQLHLIVPNAFDRPRER